MTVAVKTDGSQTTSGTTEHDLATITDAGVYDLNLDVNALAGGSTPNILEVREYIKPRSGGTERLLKVYTLVGAQSDTAFKTIPRMIAIHIRYTVKMVQGSDRAIPWAVYNA